MAVIIRYGVFYEPFRPAAGKVFLCAGSAQKDPARQGCRTGSAQQISLCCIRKMVRRSDLAESGEEVDAYPADGCNQKYAAD